MEIQKLEKRIRAVLILFVVALLLSGLTAFPLQWELTILNRFAGPQSSISNIWPSLSEWINRVHVGLQQTYDKYPFIAYGTDWLAFAHIVIAVAFWGPLKDPVRNLWVVEFGMIACVLVIPLAMICGPIRGIPFYWRLFDCALGVFGIMPLWLARRDILRLAALQTRTV
jgi:hypothetical protein